MHEDKIIQVSGFAVNPLNCHTDFLIVGVTESGRVLITEGDGQWGDISPPSPSAIPFALEEDV